MLHGDLKRTLRGLVAGASGEQLRSYVNIGSSGNFGGLNRLLPVLALHLLLLPLTILRLTEVSPDRKPH